MELCSYWIAGTLSYAIYSVPDQGLHSNATIVREGHKGDSEEEAEEGGGEEPDIDGF